MAGYALPAEFEERQVLESCRAGDDRGLDLLYRQYAPALVAFCEHRLGTVGDAEDAAHEAILKAHRAMPRFREGARLWPWLATIAANVCTDMQRSKERLTTEHDAVDCLAPDVDEDVSRRLRASIADQALDEMPERFRTPLFLREYMGWSYDDIARFSNKSIGSVRTTLMRARRSFQSHVEDVARRRGQWPLPAVVVGGRRRLRDVLRSWRDSASRAGTEGASLLWRADGFLAGLAPGLQVAVVAVVAAGTLGTSAAAGTNSGVPAAAAAPAPIAAVSSDAPSSASKPATPAKSAPVTSAAPATRVAVRPTEAALPADEVFEPTSFTITEDDKGNCSSSESLVVSVLGVPVGVEGSGDIPCPPTTTDGARPAGP